MTGPRRRRLGPAPARRRVEILLTDAEHDTVTAAATHGPGRPVSLSRYIAEAALTAAAAAGAVPSPPRAVPSPPRAGRAPSRLVLAELMDAVTAVNRIGNNLNQLAREKNITDLRPVGTRDAEQRALAALNRLAEVAERLADGAA